MKSENYSLSKFLAHAGVCSRRKATQLIESGIVAVNNQIITSPGHKITTEDVVLVNEKKVALQKHVYILLNKPAGYITTLSDPQKRLTVMDLIGDVGVRIYPVGRLDYNTTGLLLLTNDGEMAQQLAHPKYEIEKKYVATLDKVITRSDINKAVSGVTLSDGVVNVDKIYYIPGSNKRKVGLIIHSGKYRVIRRLFEKFGYKVKKLDRISYAGLEKTGLRIGQWRYLSRDEVARLKKS